MTIDSMSITNCEEPTVFYSTEVLMCKLDILISLFGLLRYETCSRSGRHFLDYVSSGSPDLASISLNTAVRRVLV